MGVPTPQCLVRVWRCEGRHPWLPHHFVCVEKSTLPYLTLQCLNLQPGMRDHTSRVPTRWKEERDGRNSSAKLPRLRRL